MISALEVRNFRSIRDLSLQLGSLTALVGPNNAGKSNLLRAIARVLTRDWLTVNSFELDDVYGRDPTLPIEIVLHLTPPLRFRPFAYGPEADVHSLRFVWTTYVRGPRKGERRLEQRCLDKNGNPVLVPAEAPRHGVRMQFVPLTTVPNQVRDQLPAIFVGTDRSLDGQAPRARGSFLGPLLDDIDRDFHDSSSTVPDELGIAEGRSQAFGRLVHQLMDLLRTPEFDRFEDDLRTQSLRMLGLDATTDNGYLDLTFSPLSALEFYKSLQLVVNDNGVQLPARLLGDGARNAIVLGLMKVYEQRRKRGALLLLEEPEMFLHPQRERYVYGILRSIATQNQIIYTTHSSHFVTIPEYTEVALVGRDPSTGTRVRRSTLVPSVELLERLRKEMDPERSELFFATRVLLVEGDTEKLALPVYARRLGLDLDAAGGTVVEVSGKQNLKPMADLVLSFGIPVGVLYDEDSSSIADKGVEEARNSELDELGRQEGCCVWRIPGNYERELRRVIGDAEYDRLTSIGGPGRKPARARRIAEDSTTPIPALLESALRWMAGSERYEPGDAPDSPKAAAGPTRMS